MRSLFFLLVAMVGLSCVRSYSALPALQFAELPYEGLDGKAWPQRSFTVQRAATFDQKQPLTVRYVELNPAGTRTLLFVHGLGSHLKFWRYQLDTFAAQGFRVLAVDLPGFGKSDKPASFPYTTESFSDVLLALLDELKLPRVVLLGHSMGGQTSMAFAIRHPERVDALVLTSPAGMEQFNPREQQWFINVFSSTFVKSAPEYAIWGSVRSGNFRRWRDELNWLVEERVRMAKADEFDAYAYAQVRVVDGLTKNDFVREQQKDITAPTLIVFGEDDRLIPNPFLHGGFARDVFQKGHERIKGSQLVGLPRCGHTVQMDCPAEYNEQVGKFLASLPPSKPAPAPAEPTAQR